MISKIEELCKNNRTGMTLQEKEVLETIADSDYVIHEIKLRLNACKDCDDYFSYKGNSYCIQKEGKK